MYHDEVIFFTISFIDETIFLMFDVSVLYIKHKHQTI